MLCILVFACETERDLVSVIRGLTRAADGCRIITDVEPRADAMRAVCEMHGCPNEVKSTVLPLPSFTLYLLSSILKKMNRVTAPKINSTFILEQQQQERHQNTDLQKRIDSMMVILLRLMQHEHSQLELLD